MLKSFFIHEFTDYLIFIFVFWRDREFEYIHSDLLPESMEPWPLGETEQFSTGLYTYVLKLVKASSSLKFS